MFSCAAKECVGGCYLDDHHHGIAGESLETVLKQVSAHPLDGCLASAHRTNGVLCSGEIRNLGGHRAGEIDLAASARRHAPLLQIQNVPQEALPGVHGAL